MLSTSLWSTRKDPLCCLTRQLNSLNRLLFSQATTERIHVSQFSLVNPEVEDENANTNWNVFRGIKPIKKAQKLIFLPGFRSRDLLAAYKQKKRMICYQRGTTHILGDTKNYNTESKYHTLLQTKSVSPTYKLMKFIEKASFMKIHSKVICAKCQMKRDLARGTVKLA